MQEDNREKQLQSKRLKEKIKKDIQTQEIQGDTLSYSSVVKTGNSGFTKNNRILYLFHGKKLAYSNELDDKAKLPFDNYESLPKLKQTVLLNEIQSVGSQKTILKIIFNKGKEKTQWEFICGQDLAKNWNKKINTSIDYLKQQVNNQPEDIKVQPVVNNQPKIQQKPLQQQIPKQPQNYGNQVPIDSNPQVNQPNNQQQPKNQKISELIKEENNLKQQQQNQSRKSESKVGQESNNINPFAALLQQPSPKKQISSPKSTLYVGSVAVDSEKDQQKLKERIDQFTTLNQKIRGEYELKRQEQKNLKQQIKNQDEGLMNLFAFSSNTKLQIQKTRKEWGYQFAKGQNQYDIIYSFKIYSQLVAMKIIDELGLQQKKRYYQPIEESSNMIRYEINGVIFQVFLTQLKQLTSFQEKGTIVSKQSSKMALNQFKNFDYILSLTHNKGKIRVPLTSYIEYKGFYVFAKVVIPSSAQGYQRMDVFDRQLQILGEQSRINNSVFQDPQCAKIVALQSKAYQKLARAQNLNSKKFDLCYIEYLYYYLPQDFNNFNKEKGNQRLRQELIQQQQYEDRILYGQDMCALANRLKLPQNYGQGMDQLRQISKDIYDRIADLIDDLENLEIIFSNSTQLSKIMHNRGINIRYLGYILERVRQNWIKQILMSEICARCGKSFLNFDLQDCILNLSESNTQAIRNFQVKQVISFLNKIFGKGQQTQIFWKQLNRQSQSYYRVSVNRQEINEGFLLQALQIHCNFRLKNTDEAINMFNSVSPFNNNNLASFQTKSKVYNLNFTQLYKSVKNLLNEPSDESYQQLRLVLNLNRVQSIPSHFKMSDMYDDILKFLVNWLPPAQAHSVYYPEEIELGQILPSLALYQIKLAEIRWGLKNNKIQQSQRVKQWTIDHINKWIGQAHPILSELYQVFANYHLLFKDHEKKAVNYAKSALRNQQKLIGTNNQKIADCYYLLGSVYLNYGKKIEAINALKRANEIIIKSENQNSEACGQVCLKLGQLHLALNSLNQATQYGLKALYIFGEAGNSLSQIKSIELVCRCYEITEDWEEYLKLIENDLVNRVINFTSDVQLTQRIIKVIILPSFKIIAVKNSAIAQKILKLMEQLPDTTRAPNMAYNFLVSRIQERVFPQRFLDILTDIQEVLQQIQNNGMITRWKGFQNLSNKSLLNKVGVNMENKGFNFIASIEALNIFIGSSFVAGVLTQN